MTVFTRTWDSSYESSPPGTQAANQLDTRIQEVKVDVRERLAVEHYMDQPGDTEDGVHKFPQKTLATRDAIGTPKDGQLIVRSDTRSIDVYDGSDWIEYAAWTPGDMKMAAYDDTAAVGWVKCDGASYLRTGIYAALFAVIGTNYGVGDGSTTFYLPAAGSVPTAAYTPGLATGAVANYPRGAGTDLPDFLAHQFIIKT